MEDNVQGEVILDFTTYISANGEIKIRGVDVKRFGVDSSPNHSNIDKDTFLLIRKLFYSNGTLSLNRAQKGEKGDEGQG